MTDSNEMSIGEFTLPVSDIDKVEITRNLITITDTTGATMEIKPAPALRKEYMDAAEKFKEAVESRKDSDQ